MEQTIETITKRKHDVNNTSKANNNSNNNNKNKEHVSNTNTKSKEKYKNNNNHIDKKNEKSSTERKLK